MSKPSDSGWNHILNISSRLISLLVIWLWYCSNVTKKKVTHLCTSIVQVFWSTLNIIPEWVSNSQIKKSFKHRKASNVAGQFAINLRKCKYSDYNLRNCKSGRHNKRHSFKRHSLRHKPCPPKNTYDGLTVKGRKEYTSHSSCEQTRLLRANISCREDIIRRPTRFKPSRLQSNKFDMNNKHVSVNSTHNDHSIHNFLLQFAPNHVDPTTDLLDEVVLTKVVLRPTEKPRSVGPHKSILNKNDK